MKISGRRASTWRLDIRALGMAARYGTSKNHPALMLPQPLAAS